MRRWRKTLLGSGISEVITAKAYRLLKAILNTAVDGGLIRRNPCRIKGGGEEKSPDRQTLTIARVFTLAEAIDAQYRAQLTENLKGGSAFGPPKSQAGTLPERLRSPPVGNLGLVRDCLILGATQAFTREVPMDDPDDPYSPENLSWNWRFGGPKWRPFSGRIRRGPRVPPPPWARSPKPSKAEREQEMRAEARAERLHLVGLTNAAVIIMGVVLGAMVVVVVLLLVSRR